MRTILAILFCSLSFYSFAQSTNFPTVLGGKSDQLSYNLRPDLQVLSVQLGGLVNGRQSLLIKIRNNGGEYAVPCNFNARFRYKPDYKSAVRTYGFSQGLPGIKPYRTIAIQTVAPPGLTLSNIVPLFVDTLDLIIVVDFDNQNNESNEQNNRFMQTYGFSN